MGIHCIHQLLQQGYAVRTTLRSLARKDEVLAMLAKAGMKDPQNLGFCVADLTQDAGWKEAVAGCTYVLHVASPFPMVQPKNEDDLIIPAREGSLRVLKAAKAAGVKRVVLTSSFAAVGYGHDATNEVFTEEDWTDANSPRISAYVKSKTVAEKAAWDYVREFGEGMELSVVNPVGIFGPILGKDLSTSVGMLKQMMDGVVKSATKSYFNLVDVRDVADLHIRAMTNPAAAGERFLCLAGKCMSMLEIATVVKKNFGAKGGKVPEKELPNWLVRAAALFNPVAKSLVPELGKVKSASNEKAKKVLGWNPRSNEESIIASAESLIAFGMVKQEA